MTVKAQRELFLGGSGKFWTQLNVYQLHEPLKMFPGHDIFHFSKHINDIFMLTFIGIGNLPRTG